MTEMHYRLFAIAASAIISLLNLPICNGFSVASPSPPDAPTRVKDTKVSVDAKSTFPVTPPPNAIADDVTLTSYMQLPVEQYVLIPMPLGSSLSTTCKSQSLDEGTEFELVVPTVSFFKVSLQPVVYASVQPQENRVVITSNQCILHGSPFIEKVQLNDRFDFCVNTTLTWEDSLAPGNAEARNDNPNDHEHETEEENDDNPPGCFITAQTCIDIQVDVPRPFSSLPKAFVEKAGNSAIKLSLKYILNNFVENLANDYGKWSTDSEYRIFRASLSEKKTVVEEEEDVLLVEETVVQL